MSAQTSRTVEHESRNMWTGTALAVGVGVVAAVALALETGAGLRDALTVVGLAVVGSAAGAAGGALVVRGLRHRTLRVQALVIGLAATLTTAAGVFVAGSAMFISGHDVVVLAVMLLVSAGVSVGAALWLGRAFEQSVAEMTGLARGLTQPGGQRRASDTVVTDEMRRLAEELRSVSVQLEESRRHEAALDASRRELVAWVSHDLRSPLAAIRAMAEALEDGVADDAESVGRYHRAIGQESERLAALVDDLFELSRIASGSIDPDQTLVPIGELVAELMEGTGPAAAARGVKLVNHIESVPGVLVPAYDLRRALHNLLDNAIRHTPAGGRVVLDGALTPGEVALSVADECGGIPDADLRRVFEVAFRGDTARTRDEAGGGLGLAIAKGLVEAHCGTIQVTNSAPGCRFTLRLPVGEQ